jgi:hypothetical protein
MVVVMVLGIDHGDRSHDQHQQKEKSLHTYIKLIIYSVCLNSATKVPFFDQTGNTHNEVKGSIPSTKKRCPEGHLSNRF